MQLIKFEIFADRVGHAFTTRHGGVSSPPFESMNLGFQYDDPEQVLCENHRLLCEHLGVDMGSLVIPLQEHTDVVMRVDGAGGYGQVIEGVDGFVTNVPGLVLLVRCADCQAALFFDPVKRAVAAVHSGWRGNAQNILGKAVEKMVAEYGSDPADILVAIGPSLGPCCAEFSEPFEELPKEMHQFVNAHKHVDLWECSHKQLRDAGVLCENIENPRICTACNTDQFFSYRAEKPKTGRMAALIWL